MGANAIILFAMVSAVVNRAYGIRAASGRHICSSAANAIILLRWDARFETAPTGFVLRPAGIYYFALGCAV